MQVRANIGGEIYIYTLNPSKLKMVQKCFILYSCIDFGKMISASKRNVKLGACPLKESVTVCKKVTQDSDGLFYSVIKKDGNPMRIDKDNLLVIKFKHKLNEANSYITIVKG